MRHAGTNGRRARRRGFSVVELLIVVAVTSVGFVALLQLQVASIRGLNYPAQLTAAVNLGEHFLATLRMEGIEWTGNGAQTWDSTNLHYLPTLAVTQALSANSPQGWQVAVDHFVDQAGADGDYDRGVLGVIAADKYPRFCIQYRLSWATASQKLIRAEVRVLWMRDEAAWDLDPFRTCDPQMAEARYLSQVQSVTLTDQILINSGS
jgi:prepilin-type N-terminal cleavage/methylation domain-containing protein